MKKILFTLLLLLSSTFAQERPVFLLLWSDSCVHCQSFINGAMQDPTIKTILKQFDVEAINVNEQKNVPYDIDFLGIVPSVHILNQQKSQLVNTITGNIPAKDLEKFLTKFLELYAKAKN